MYEAATDIKTLPVIWKRMVRRLLETNNGALRDYLSALNLTKAYTNFLQLQQIADSRSVYTNTYAHAYMRLDP